MQKLLVKQQLRSGTSGSANTKGLSEMLKLVRSLLRPTTVQRFFKLLFAVVFVRVVGKFYQHIQWRDDLLRRFSCPKPHLLLGNLMEFVRAGGFNEEFFRSLHERHGEFAGFFLLPNLFNLSITHPEAVLELYKKTKSRPKETHMFLNYLGDDNLMFTHGPMVKQLRLRYGSMITNKHQLNKLNTTAIEQFTNLVDSWGKKSQVNVYSEMAPTIYDVMGRVLFGSGWLNEGIRDEVYANHKYLLTNVNKFMILPWLQPFGYMKYLNAIKTWRKLCDNLLSEREKEMLEQGDADAENDESALTMLLTAKREDDPTKKFFSRHLAVSTLCGFLNGAYDTTQATSYWLIYNLARHPDKQDRLREEINKCVKIAENGELAFSIEDARKVDYLDAFIKESMRTHATAPVNQRINYEEDLVLMGKYVIPKGTNVNVPTSLVFKYKEYFGDDVESFRPERFLPEDPFCEKAKKAWIGFGGSSRMCVGNVFALVELKVILILILKKFHVKFADETQCYTDKVIEAGVNQPEKKLFFKFVPYNSTY